MEYNFIYAEKEPVGTRIALVDTFELGVNILLWLIDALKNQTSDTVEMQNLTRKARVEIDEIFEQAKYFSSSLSPGQPAKTKSFSAYQIVAANKLRDALTVNGRKKTEESTEALAKCFQVYYVEHEDFAKKQIAEVEKNRSKIEQWMVVRGPADNKAVEASWDSVPPLPVLEKPLKKRNVFEIVEDDRKAEKAKKAKKSKESKDDH